MLEPAMFGGEIELYGLSHAVKTQIRVLQDFEEETNKCLTAYGPEYEDCVAIKYTPLPNSSGHYDAVAY